MIGSFAIMIAVHPIGLIGGMCWSLWCNAMQLFIIIVLARGVTAREVLISPGFTKRYEQVFLENLEYIKDNAKISSELEWIKNKPASVSRIVQRPHPGTQRFVSSNDMTTREKRVRAYLMAEQGVSDEDIAKKIGLKKTSIPGYKSDGKKIVEPYKGIIKGHTIDEIVEFLCH